MKQLSNHNVSNSSYRALYKRKNEGWCGAEC